MTEGSGAMPGDAVTEADWRALVEQGLKGASWERLTGKTADGLPIPPLYREPDIATAADASGFPGAAPFTRGARAGAWIIRQSFAHPDPAETNRDILADLAGGASGVELVIDPRGEHGVRIDNAAALDLALADVILEAAPVSLDAGAHALQAAEWFATKLKGVAAAGTAFNLDPIGAAMRAGAEPSPSLAQAAAFARRVRSELPAATAIRVDARPVHEAGGTEAQEIATALSCGIAYLRALKDAGLSADDAAAALVFAVSVGPDVLVETAKLRALRLCWARVLQASGASAEARAARLQAFTSRRMMTRYDAHTNILRVSCAAFAAAIGDAEAITTYPFTDALGLPTAFARRVARNTQNVILEESRLDQVSDPAGGAWFVEKLTRDLAALAWSKMQTLEKAGGGGAALKSGELQKEIAQARAARQRAIATRRETITGVSDFPLLGAAQPEVRQRAHPAQTGDAGLAPIRWAEPFEALRDRAEAAPKRPAVFFATLGALASFGPRAQFSRNLFAAGGVAPIGEETEYASRDAMIDAFRASSTRIAVICGTDATYAEEAENAAQRLKAAGADWVALAGKPGDLEQRLRAAGVDQFVFTGQDALKELETLHAALGLAS